VSGIPNERQEVAVFVPPSRRVLDVGCDWGAFGAVLVERGSEVWGIEMDPGPASEAATRLHQVIVGRFPDDVPQGETFDCIVFNDVLEHMVEPASALIATRGFLAVGGCVVASIPNVRHLSVLAQLLIRGRWDYTDWGILASTHLRFFTKSTMRELFERNGYRVERQEPINVGGSTGKWRVLRLLGRRSEEFLAAQYVLVARPCL